MITASNEFLRALRDNHNLKIKIDATLTDGTQLTIQNPNIRMDSLSFDKATSDDSSFDIGSFIIGKLSFTLNNIPGTYNGMNFDGAVLVLSFANNLHGGLYPSNTLYPGTNLYPGQISSQYVQIGTYTVVDTDGQNGAWISLVAYDNANKFLAPLSGANVTFPTTASAIVSAVCSYVGVSVPTIPSALASITIPALSDGLTPNCLQAIAWCAMLCGKNATINPIGQLVFTWYDTATLASVRTDIETNGWDGADLSAIHEMTGLINVSTMVEDVTITGVTVTYQNADGEDVTTSLSGSEGYVINLAENAFVDVSNVTAVLANVSYALIGLRFRPFEVTMMGNPLLEPGDIVYFHNRKGEHFLSVLTSMSYPVGNHMTALCGAEAPEKRSASDYSATTRLLQQTKAIAQRASRIAGNTNQYFWHTETGTDTGAHITEVTQEEFLADPANGGGNLLARSNGIAVRDGLTELATFSADGAVIGKANDTKVKVGSRKMAVISSDGYNVFLADASRFMAGPGMEIIYRGVNIITLQSFAGRPVDITAYINGTSTEHYTLEVTTSGGVTTVNVIFDTNYLSTGNRIRATWNGLVTIGQYSFGVRNGDTSGDWSCVVGYANTASGAYSMATGHVTEATGEASFTSGTGTIASADNQAVFGKYNVDDSDSALIIGNGEDDDNRSNLFAVKNDGTIETNGSVIASPTIADSVGTQASLTDNTPTTIASVRLKKGVYVLTGCAHYANNATGTRTLRFSFNDNGTSADNFGAIRIQAISGGRTVMTHTWTCQIDNDDTTVYLVGNQDSGGALTVYNPDIRVLALNGGGIYTEG